VSIVAVKQVSFADGSQPALQLVYETTKSLDDTLGLRKEAREIWGAWHVEVERRHFRTAIMTPTRKAGTLSSAGGVMTYQSYGFFVDADPNGRWHLEGDTAHLVGRASPLGTVSAP
jgi:hypothetical protein